GLGVFEKLKESSFFHAKVIVITGNATRVQSVKAIQLGAYAFIDKQINFDKNSFVLNVKQAINLKKQEDYNRTLELENKQLRESSMPLIPFIGDSSSIKKVKGFIEKYGPTDINVLIEGETGTGKEIVANHLFWKSKRTEKPFITINSSAIPENLIESELFGYKKGAFTEASKDKIGYIEKANKGTVFLDEISNLNYTAQAKILRTLEYNEIQILGGDIKKVDTRFIIGTNKNLFELIEQEKFRDDLYYRMEGNKIILPPLRERGQDIVLLMNFFFDKYKTKYKITINAEIENIQNKLLEYRWPGNIRELKNFCENLVITNNHLTEDIIISEINNKLTGKQSKKADKNLQFLFDINEFSDSVQSYEEQYIKFHLEKNKWKIKETAEAIGIEKSTLYKKLKKYGIE
ncbi:sigma-54-dependent transcriptional regulator, partial [Bacteroidota bacterium]